MALSVFDDKSIRPNSEALAGALGKGMVHWSALRDGLAEALGDLDEEWSFAGKVYGWSCRLKRGKRTVIYLTPCRGHFLAGLVIGEKAFEAARSAGLPVTLLAALESAPRYTEGRGLRVPVRTKKDAEGIRQLALIKMAA